MNKKIMEAILLVAASASKPGGISIEIPRLVPRQWWKIVTLVWISKGKRRPNFGLEWGDSQLSMISLCPMILGQNIRE